MVKNHLKSISAPKTWNIPRKETIFVTRPKPGAHNLTQAMSLSLVMRELLKVAKSAKEVKKIISTKDVFVDKKKRSEEKIPVGLMDVIEFPQLEEYYRIVLDEKGRLSSLKVTAKEANHKLSKITSKTVIAGKKVQINTSDGRTLVIDKDAYKTGDTLKLQLPEQKIEEHLPLEKGALTLLTGGKHAGAIATVEEISGRKILLKRKTEKFETLKKHAFVVGKDKPALDSIKQLM